MTNAASETTQDPTEWIDPARAFDYENAFHLTASVGRIAKFAIHYELLHRTIDVPGAIIEAGVFKGASLAFLAGLRDVFGLARSKRLVGFDTFALFPETTFEPDRAQRQAFIEEAGAQSVSVQRLQELLDQKGMGKNIELVAGDVCETVPRYLRDHPELVISFVNLDTDLYEPARVILEEMWPRLSIGGILALDDYGVFPGETKAADEFFGPRGIRIRQFPYRQTPCYVVKEEG